MCLGFQGQTVLLPILRYSHGMNFFHRKVSDWETPKDSLCLPFLLGCCPLGRSASAWRWKLSCSSPPACLASGISLTTSNSYPLNPSSLWSVARHLHAWIPMEKRSSNRLHFYFFWKSLFQKGTKTSCLAKSRLLESYAVAVLVCTGPRCGSISKDSLICKCRVPQNCPVTKRNLRTKHRGLNPLFWNKGHRSFQSEKVQL